MKIFSGGSFGSEPGRLGLPNHWTNFNLHQLRGTVHLNILQEPERQISDRSRLGRGTSFTRAVKLRCRLSARLKARALSVKLSETVYTDSHRAVRGQIASHRK